MICKRKACGKEFTPNIWNQEYCRPACATMELRDRKAAQAEKDGDPEAMWTRLLAGRRYSDPYPAERRANN